MEKHSEQQGARAEGIAKIMFAAPPLLVIQ